MTYRYRYFRPVELDCDCGCGLILKDSFVEKLDELRHRVKMPFYLNSAARCETHNDKVGGSPASAHKLQRAADVRILNPEFEEKVITEAKAMGLRLGYYDSFLHIDDMLGERNHFDRTKDKRYS